MRTTLTIDDDLAEKLKGVARRRRLSFKEVVNAMLRRGLTAQASAEKAGSGYCVETFRSAFRAGIDPLKLNQLVDDLDALPRQAP